MGIAFDERGDSDSAIASFQAAVRFSKEKGKIHAPTDNDSFDTRVMSHTNLGIALMSVKRYSEAASILPMLFLSTCVIITYTG